MTRIALMRHFPTAWNRDRRLQGRRDITLTEASRAELARLALPAPWDAARIVASPLARAHDTARILARGQPVETEPRLIEIAYGAWEGRRGADLLADPASGYVHVEDGGWHRRAPGGESHWEVWLRVRPALAEIAAAGRPALIVAHRALMRAVLAHAWGWGFDSPEPFRIKRGRLYPMTLGPDGMPASPEASVALVARESAR